MEGAIDIWIGQAEKNWLKPLYAHARELYLSTFLPSHDHSHHLRVWNIAKQVLRELDSSHASLHPSMVEGVLIACMFHDLGMAQSTREDHGRLGRDLCQAWFLEHGYAHPPFYERILEAIELHDRKEVGFYGGKDGTPGVLGILSVADDLEAMGYIGIYRYAEIYLHRGISLEDLGKRILENAELRFQNLRAPGLCTRLMKKYSLQFEELTHFYVQYNLQLNQVKQAETVREDQLGVINYIRSRSMAGKVRPEDLIHLAEVEGETPMLREFLSKLSGEIQKARE